MTDVDRLLEALRDQGWNPDAEQLDVMISHVKLHGLTGECRLNEFLTVHFDSLRVLV